MAYAARRVFAAACAMVFLAGCTSADNAGPGVPTPSVSSGSRPNIVFVLTDDLSNDLVPYMDQVGRLADEGTTFNDYFVANSLCCPSRASILTGKLPHNTGVLTNSWPLGGFGKFFLNDLDDAAGPLLQAAGYRTGFMGKFMNEYEPAGMATARPHQPTYPAGYIPPGWNEWDAFDSGGYEEFNYTRAVAIDAPVGKLVTTTGDAEGSYVTDVLSHDAGDFIARAADGSTDTGNSPFFLMVSTYGTHSAIPPSEADTSPVVFPPAPRDRPSPADPELWPSQWVLPEFPGGDCGDPDGGGCAEVAFPPTASEPEFGVTPTNAPSWMNAQHYTAAEIAQLRDMYIQRIQMAQSIDDLVGQLRTDLAAAGVLDNTYIVFSSDNGFHLGEHDLWFGKRTAFDHDIKVPLIIRPPDGRTTEVNAIAENTDLLPTFLDIAGAPASSINEDGRSLLPLIGEGVAANWRTGAFIEQREDPGHVGSNPDAEAGATRPPSYRALRTASYLYVDYGAPDADPTSAREGEFYDLRTDPHEMSNIYSQLTPADKVALAQAIITYGSCAGSSCRLIDRALPVVSATGSS